MHSTLHRKETGQLLLFSLNTIYGCLIHPAAEGTIHQWTGTEISSSFVITDPQFQLPFLPSYTALLPHLPTYLSLIPSFFHFIHFLSQLHTHTHTHASACAFTGSDWWLDKVLLMEPPGCQSSRKKKKGSCLCRDCCYFINPQPQCVCVYAIIRSSHNSFRRAGQV